MASPAMISDDVQKIQLAAKTRSLDDYKLRCQELRSENDELKNEKTKQESESMQIISFLRRDLERKDELIESLKNTINQHRETFTQQREDERQTASNKMAEMEEDFKLRDDEREQLVADLQEELRRLQDFKENKASIEQRLEEGEQERLEMEADHKLALEALERKFLEEKGRLQKEYKQMLAEMKKTSQEEAVERLDSSTKKILFENRRMAEELRLQVQETDELQKAKKTLEEDCKKLRREVQLHEQSVKEYAKQGFRQSKEIKELAAKVKSLEKTLSASVRDFEKEREQLSSAERRKSTEAALDSHGLRSLLKLKTKELAHIKRLAAVVLQKRTEVEAFLLDSLEVVKSELVQRRREEERSAARSNSIGRLPALAGSRHSNLPTSAEEHVDIRDLTWEDRERVLRLLFSKINHSQSLHSMPPHALRDDNGELWRAGGAPKPADFRGENSSGMGDEGGLAPFPGADPSFFVTQPEPA